MTAPRGVLEVCGHQWVKCKITGDRMGADRGGAVTNTSHHLNESRIMGGHDISRSDMQSTPIPHEPHCPRGDNKRSAVATAPDPENEGGGKNYRALCHCEAACK